MCAIAVMSGKGRSFNQDPDLQKAQKWLKEKTSSGQDKWVATKEIA